MHDAVYQFTGLGDVVCLAPSERESQWIARSVGAYLHFRAETSLDFSQEPEAFVLLSSLDACLVFKNSITTVTNRASYSTPVVP